MTMTIRTIQTRLLLAMVILILTPILILNEQLRQTHLESHTRALIRGMTQIADKKAGQIEFFIQDHLEEIQLLGHTPLVIEGIRTLQRIWKESGPESDAYARADTLLRSQFAEYLRRGHYYDAFLIALDGTVIFSIRHEPDFGTNLRTGPLRFSELAKVVKVARTMLEPDFSEYDLYPPSNAPAAFLAGPVMDGQQLVGVVAMQFDMHLFTEVMLDNTGLGESGATLMARLETDQVRFLLPMKSDPEAAFRRTLPLASNDQQPIIQAAQGKHGSAFTRDHQGENVLAVWRHLPALRVGLVIQMNANEAMAEFTQSRYWEKIFLAGVVGALLLISWYVHRAVVQPIQELTRVTEALSAGDLGQRAWVVRQDETGRLAAAFNTMADKLLTAQLQLEERVQARTAELHAANQQLHMQITQRKETEARLLLAHKVIENAGEAILITDAQGFITHINPAYERITGWSRAQIIGKKPSVTKSGRHDQNFYQQMWQTLNDTGRWEGEIWDRRANGETFPKWLSITAIHDDQHQVLHYVGVFLDISQRKADEQRLEHLAYYDPLTALPNRSLFHERLEREISGSHRQRTGFALFFIDLDRFKQVNDTLGHGAGDELLIIVAERLLSRVRENDTVARLGGDEFTIILTHVTRPEQVSPVAQNLLDSLQTPLVVAGQEVRIGGSIGIALYPHDGTSREQLTQNADMAMYLAKEKGRNNYQFFSKELQTRILDRVTLENELTKAIQHQELLLHYQPKFNLEGNRVAGVESLVRWNHPEKGLISPARFIPLAEETGLILPMGTWILEESCRQIKIWNAKTTHPWHMAVNLSPRQFQQPNLLPLIKELLDKTNISPEWLELEITEGVLMGNVEESIAIMNRLRDSGIRLAMDDFGTGYSSLNHLKRFPVHTLKIDQSFVRELTPNSTDAIIVQAIITLARALGLTVVAEGVETVEQLEFLKKQECHLVQGYLFSKPLPAQDLERFYT
ncbi:MAG: EAL domain-containing protein [Magnetococcales bacterium]|nr:EAL domain-containing protein [Magnetococcales bacterium]